MKNTKRVFIVTLICAIVAATFVSCAVNNNRQNDSETTSDAISTADKGTTNIGSETNEPETSDNSSETTTPSTGSQGSETTGSTKPETSESVPSVTEKPVPPETRPSHSKPEPPKTEASTTEKKDPETQKPETEKEDIKVEVPIENKPTQAETSTWEQGQQELKDKVDKYLEDNNIDPDTAGATGKTCVRCGKPIWNPDKFGFCIPGDPESGYYSASSVWCDGACHIILR